MKTNYHSHTLWCRHATGSVDEVAKKAIEVGLEEIAFTEHVSYPDYNSSRPRYEELDQIFNEIEEAQKKYANNIKIFKSLECEYAPKFHDYYQQLKEKYDLDFLILGHHFSEVPPINDYFNISEDNVVLEFEKTIIQAINSGLFKMVAHPDVFLNGYPFNELAEKVSHNICKALEENNIYVEINANGLRNKCNYPNKGFFTISKEYNLKYLINADSHNLSHLDDEYITKAYEFANELGIEVDEYMY